MKYLVVQRGARHHYAVPRMLERGGLLSALYTDICADTGLGWLLTALTPKPLRRGMLRRLADRQAQGVPSDKIRPADIVVLHEMLSRLKGQPVLQRNRTANAEFSRRMIRWGTGDADAVYTMQLEGKDFVRFAKSRGLTVVSEIYITPIHHRIVREERARFPGWEEQEPPEVDARSERSIAGLMAIADLLICPSPTVVDGLRSLPGFAPDKIRVVPYGCSVEVAHSQTTPQPGRVLFPGAPTLRKGIHYLAQAAAMLVNEETRYDFRVAGSADKRVTERPECRHLDFLGQVPRSRMTDEYLAADVVVLPTLAEGSAEAIYEALAAGTPVVTTASAGSVVTDGVEGFIVAERDAAGLANAIRAIVSDRPRRTAMAEAARTTAALYSEARWAERLRAALMAVEPPGQGIRADSGSFRYAPSS